MSGTQTSRGNTIIGNLIVNAVENPLGRQNANFALNWAESNYQSVILAASGLTITAPAVGVGFFQLKVIQDSVGSRTLPAFAPAITWLGSTPVLSTAAGAADLLRFYCDGTNFFGIGVTSSSGGVSFPLLAPDGNAAAPSYSFANEAGTGVFRAASGRIGFSTQGVIAALIDNNSGNRIVTDNYVFGLATADVILTRDAANTLAQRNGVNAQAFRVYNTFTDAANYERAALSGVAGSSVGLSAETAGTGADNLDVTLTPAGTGLVRFGAFTVNADAPVTGYISVKDAAGNTRKLAIIA